VVMDGPKAQVLAVLSGAKPAAQAAPPNAAGEVAAPTNVHRHPSTQPSDSRAAV
jgi:ATP-binding cassette subfamily C protein LapB